MVDPTRRLPARREPSFPTRTQRRAFAALGTALAATVAGCGGGGVGSSHALPQAALPGSSGPQTPGAAQKQTVTVKLRIPPGRKSGLHARNPKYVSSATAGIAISVVPHGTALPSSPQFAAPIGSPYCIPQPDQSQHCAFPVAAPIGNDDFDVALYDQAPTSAGMPVGNVLSHTLSSNTVAPNATNAFTMILGGTVAALSFTNGRWTANGNSAGALFTASVAAFDAAGELIVGSENYDQPVTVTATSTGSTDGLNHLTVTTGSKLNGPADNSVVVTWDGVPFAAASIGVSVGGNSGSSPFTLPLPNALAQVPVTIPPQSRGDVALGFTSTVNGPGGFAVVPGSATQDNETINGGFFAQSAYAVDTNDLTAALQIAVLPDASVAAAYEAYLHVGGMYMQDAVEVDVTAPAGGGTLNGFSNTFYTDLCQVFAATGDASGNIVLVGDSGVGCGVPAGTAASVATLSAAHHSLGRAMRPAASSRSASGQRRFIRAGAPSTPTYAIEIIQNAGISTFGVGVKPSAEIVDANLTYATGIAADGVGQYYVADNTGYIDVYNPSVSTSGPAGRIPVAGPSATSPSSIAVDGLGRIAVMFTGDNTPTLQIYSPYPAGAGSQTPETPLATFMAPGAGYIAFDRFNNLWVASGSAKSLSAYPPFPTVIPPTLTPQVGAPVGLSSAPSAIGAFRIAMNQSAPVQPTPTPTPSPSPTPTPSPAPTSSPSPGPSGSP